MKRHFFKCNRPEFSRWLLMALFVLVNTGWVFAQSGTTVTGAVIDEFGEPLPGANVIVKGTTNGTVTDLNGRYTVTITPEEKTTFVFSFIGYKTKEIVLGDKREINVQLNPDQEMLDEVVVIGYGSVKKGDVTSAVSQVKTKYFFTNCKGSENQLTIK
jgi:hypothetical protein